MSQTPIASPSARPQPPPELNPSLSSLWQEAVREYRQAVTLSTEQEKLLQRAYSAEDFLRLTKEGWDETIVKRRSRHYQTIRTAVLDVLGIFDNVSTILGLASAVFLLSLF